jgi:hypothetical protein
VNAHALALALRQALLGLPWHTVHDRADGGRPIQALPSIDLAVVGFPAEGPPLAANVLLSREHPQGQIAALAPGFGAVQGLQFQADQRDDQGESPAWGPGADWPALHFAPLHGASGPRFVAPYPASLVKLMVAVGVATLVDAGRCHWDTPQTDRGGRQQTLAGWCDAMLTVSDNEATDACVAALHRHGAIGLHHNEVQALFQRLGLPTLRLQGTRPDGGWRNADGAGVGRLQMTAWDTVRLLWWLDADAPPPPWLAAQAPRLSASSQARLRGWLQAQQLSEVLSSGRHSSLPGWVPGIPDAEVAFAHKTGTTDNYGSDAGIVRARPPARRHYIVAVTSSLGRRYAPHPDAAVPWCLPQLGAAVDRLMASALEPAG